MSTENRSSNTEMVSAAPAPKRNRIYVEVRECEGCNHIGIDDAHSTLGACHECDWSGPEPVEDKCPGCGRENVIAAACPDCGSRYVLATSKEFEVPAPQPHPEPIAWMVGTAFWWTKEEAERDAAATGLTVVPVGPMVDTAEVECQKSRADTNALNHRHAKNAIGGIKAYVERLVAASNGQPSVATGYLSDIVAFIVERTTGDPTETSDINALRLELQESRRNEFNTCAKLAEAQALLREAACHAARMEPMSASRLNRIDTSLARKA